MWSMTLVSDTEARMLWDVLSHRTIVYSDEVTFDGFLGRG